MRHLADLLGATAGDVFRFIIPSAVVRDSDEDVVEVERVEEEPGALWRRVENDASPSHDANITLGMAKSLESLRGMSDEELIARRDAMAVNTVHSLNEYDYEVRRREQAKSDEVGIALARSMNELTVEIRDMTRVIKGLTWVAVIAAVVGVIVSIVK